MIKYVCLNCGENEEVSKCAEGWSCDLCGEYMSFDAFEHVKGMVNEIARLKAENKELNGALDVYLNETLPNMLKTIAEL